MTRDPLFNRLAAAFLAFAASYPCFAFAQAAGQFDFVRGNVTVVNVQGQTRVARQGMEINAGDTLVTGESGRAQLRFSDGAYVSLQPDTRFRIDEYNYRGTTDGNEKGFFSLVKGGLRAITGAIGKINHASYQVTTPVATIGIRGTHYRLRFCESNCYDAGRIMSNGLYASVGEGQITVGNRVGTLQLPQGRSGFVANVDTPPVPTDRSVDVRPAKIERVASREQDKEKEKEKERQGETVRTPVVGRGLREKPTLITERDDKPALTAERVVTEKPVLTLDAPVLAERTLLVDASLSLDTTVKVELGEERDEQGLLANLKEATAEVGTLIGAAVADDNATFRDIDAGKLDVQTGLVASVDRSAGVTTENVDAKIFPDTNGDKLMLWGRWTEGTVNDTVGGETTRRAFSDPQSLHYVATLMPTPASFFTVGGGRVLTYDLLSGTPATSLSGSGAGVVGGTLALDLTSPTALLSLNDVTVDFQKALYVMNGTITPSTRFNLNPTVTGAACGRGCTGVVNGIFGGPNADRAGFVYQINDTSQNIHGAAAFKQQ